MAATRHQFDLFAPREGCAPAPPIAPSFEDEAPSSALSDTRILTNLRSAPLPHRLVAIALLAERRTAEAVPDLLALCRRHIGYDHTTANAEQLAALGALGHIGGREAATGLVALFRHRAFGPRSAQAALTAAYRQGLVLPDEITVSFLRADGPDVREAPAGSRVVDHQCWPCCATSPPTFIGRLPSRRRRLWYGIGIATGVGLLLQAAECDSVDADVVDAIATLAETDRPRLRRPAAPSGSAGRRRDAARKALDADDEGGGILLRAVRKNTGVL